MIRVVLIDDQELVRAGLRGIFREPYGFEVVGEGGNGEEAARVVQDTRPDVVVMDVRMPVLDGVGATRRIVADPDSPPVLALTTFDDDHALGGMLRAGASGFVLKGAPAEELQRAVRVVAEGGAWLDPAVTGRVLRVYRDAARPPRQPDDELNELTARELEVLALIGRGFTNDEIAGRLVVSLGTVKTHINHIFSKLELRNRAAAVILAFDHGLLEDRRRA